MNSESYFCKIFENIEKKYPVETWKLNGINIWPYIRIKLYIFLLSEAINCSGHKEHIIFADSKIKMNKLRLFGKKLSIIVKSFFISIYFFFRIKRKRIIFVGSHFHRVREKGEYFNRFFDTMIKSHSLEREVYFLEYQKLYSKNFNQSAIIELEKQINAFKNILLFFPKKKLKKNDSLTDYVIFLEKIQKKYPKVKTLNLSIKDLDEWTTKINSISLFYRIFFSKIKPEKIIFSGYYGWDNLYAAILTANKMKIKTIDFQHGPQTNHMVFSSWNKIPKKGYDLMPREYWVWDDFSKLNIKGWANKQNIKVKVAGQPYLSYRGESISKVKNQVLFTLQTFPLNNMLPDFILNSIVNSQYIWVFRLHPRNIFSNQEIKKFLSSKGIDKSFYRLENPQEVSLADSLSRSVLHITAFSGCLIEARLLKVPSIIVHEIGKSMFENYIDEELIYHFDPSKGSFSCMLSRVISKSKNAQVNTSVQKIINPLIF